jgi:hypothetical protein
MRDLPVENKRFPFFSFEHSLRKLECVNTFFSSETSINPFED